MKIFSLLRGSGRGWKFWPLLMVFFALLWYLKGFTPLNHYPVSDVVINPISGKYDENLELLVMHTAGVDDEKDTALINLGDRTPQANTLDQDVLLVLSPVIRMHPKPKVFIVQWIMICCSAEGTSDDGQEFIYNRSTGKILYHSRGHFQTQPYDRTQLLGSGIKDSDIHRLASQNRPYTDFALGY